MPTMLTPFKTEVLAMVLATITLPCCLIAAPNAQAAEQPESRPADLPSGAKWASSLSNDGLNTFVDGKKLWLLPTEPSLDAGSLKLKRLCAPIRSLRWHDSADRDLKFVPEPDHWRFSWKGTAKPGALIEVVMDGPPLLSEQCPRVKPSGDGSIMLFAHQAKTFGEKLRFEPQWYKNTVGYWTIQSDYATWELTADSAGEYSVAVLQGCGQGAGGSDALITLSDAEQTVAELPFQTVDTGHFQNFRWNHLGRIKIKNPGDLQLKISATKIAKVALFDVRAIHLVKQAK